MKHRFQPGPFYWDGRCLVCGLWESQDGFRGSHYRWWAVWRS